MTMNTGIGKVEIVFVRFRSGTCTGDLPGSLSGMYIDVKDLSVSWPIDLES
jgi:hypothetical protein